MTTSCHVVDFVFTATRYIQNLHDILNAKVHVTNKYIFDISNDSILSKFL